jgi:hypothetical protein
MSDNPYYYNGDDWRLFDPDKFNTVNVEVKDNQSLVHEKHDQIKHLIEKIKNRPF